MICFKRGRKVVNSRTTLLEFFHSKVKFFSVISLLASMAKTLNKTFPDTFLEGSIKLEGAC